MGNWDEKISEENKQRIEDAKQQTQDVECEFKSLADAEQKRDLKVGIYGDYATGKTHFALTAPEPIFIIDTELGASPLAYLFKDKDVRIIDVAEKDGTASYNKVIQAMEYIAKQEKVGTVIFDSVTDLWEYCQEYAKVNIFKIKPEQRLAQQWDWGVINKLYANVMLRFLKMNCNLILTAREQEVYGGAGKPLDIYKPKWQKNTGFLVDFVLYNTKKIDKLGTTTFSTTIEKSRPVGSLMGKKFPNLDFNKLNEEVIKAKEVLK